MVAVPLIAKGMAEAEGGTVDMNYFLGIRSSDNVLVADFEDTATGLNHPVAGTTAIPSDGAWRHAAATYDGTTWRLYLDGVLQAQLVVGAFTPQFNSIQHATLGTRAQLDGRHRLARRRASSTARWTRRASGTTPARHSRSAADGRSKSCRRPD